jgi:hypothetical protein
VRAAAFVLTEIDLCNVCESCCCLASSQPRACLSPCTGVLMGPDVSRQLACESQVMPTVQEAAEQSGQDTVLPERLSTIDLSE